MRAQLITRCGCKREFNVTYPPPPDIQIPLMEDEIKLAMVNLPPLDPQTLTVKTRRFVLSKDRGGHPAGLAVYFEEE